MGYNGAKKDWVLKFDCPDVSTHKDRYCSCCGMAVKTHWVRCNEELCHQLLKKDVPVPALPVGWVFCSKCQVIPMAEGQAFCRYCGNAGPRGVVFREKAKQFKRQKMLLTEQFKIDAHGAMNLFPPPPVAPIIPPQVAPNNEDQVLLDEDDNDLANLDVL